MAKQKSINDKLTDVSSGLTITPAHTAEEIIELIPDRIWNSPDLDKMKFLDICAKSGAFPAAIRKKLLTVGHFVAKYDNEDDLELAIEHMLYCIVPTEQCAGLVRRKLYGDYKYKGNVVVLGNTYKEFEQFFKLDYKPSKGNTLYTHLENQLKLRKEHIEKIFSDMEGNKVTFDVVVGNPPYNSDIYLDFVQLGHKMSKDCSCMITPAKWQAKGGQKNEDFRKNIVPYMSEIVMYKDSTDIFDIEEWGGIAYYLIDRYKHDEKNIKNVCTKNSALCSDVEKHNEEKLLLMPNSVKSIVNKLNVGTRLCDSCNFSRFTYTSEQERGHKYIDGGDNIAIVQGTKYTGGYLEKRELKTVDKLDKFKVITSCMWGNGNAIFDSTSKVLGVTNMSIVKPNEVPKGSFIILKYFDTEEQCKAFISFMYSKVIAFCIYLGLVGATLNKEFWRFIPDPGAFDHIFTDEELYKKYNLTKEEINIIESVIKERK